MTSTGIHINPVIKQLRCSLSGEIVDPEGFVRPIGLCSCCPAPGKPVIVDYDAKALRQAVREHPPFGGGGSGLARFEAMLPVCGVPDDYWSDVGDTPSVRQAALSDRFGVDAFIKCEGANPSGSFKDRGLSVAVALGHACGAERFCLPTQGNAGVAASLFSARLGLPGCVVYMPDGYQDSIYHREAAFFGAVVRFAGTNIAQSGKQMRDDLGDELAARTIVDVSTFFEPGRLEGKKTMGLEIVEQLGADTLPDVILYPTGGGTGLVGIWKAFAELESIDLLDRSRHQLPRMVAVQSSNCAPVVEAFHRGLDHVEPVVSKGTVADGLDVPGAIMGHGILSAIRQSGGTAVAVDDQNIRDETAASGRLGLTIGYESAALVSALRKMRDGGQVREGEKVLLLFTATHLIPLGQRVP